MSRIHSSHIEYGEQDQTTLTRAARFAEFLQAMFLLRKLTKQYGSEEAIPEHEYPYTSAERQLKVFAVLRRIMEQVALEFGFVPDFAQAYTQLMRLEGGNFRGTSHAEREAMCTGINPYRYCYDLLVRSSNSNAVAKRLNKYRHRKNGSGVAAFLVWVDEQDVIYHAQLLKLQLELQNA